MSPEFLEGDLWYSMPDTARWLGRKPTTFRGHVNRYGDEYRLFPYMRRNERGQRLFNASALHRDWEALYTEPASHHH